MFEAINQFGKKNLTGALLILYLFILIATSTLSLLEIQGFFTVLVIVRFIALFIYYIFSSKNINYTFLALIGLNTIADLIFVQENFYSFLLSMSIFLVINLVFSYLIYTFFAFRSESFKIFIIPILILAILFGYIFVAFFENERYLFFVYSFSLILLVYNAVLYYSKRSNKEGIYMLLGVLFLFISGVFTWLDMFVGAKLIYTFFDTLFYGIALLLITLAVIFEDNKTKEDLSDFNLKI